MTSDCAPCSWCCRNLDTQTKACSLKQASGWSTSVQANAVSGLTRPSIVNKDASTGCDTCNFVPSKPSIRQACLPARPPARPPACVV